MTDSRVVRASRIARARYRRWKVSRRRAVPRPLLARLRAVGVVAVVIGLIAQTLAGWEGPAAAGAAPRVGAVSSAEAVSDTIAIDVPPVARGDVSLVVVTRAASAVDEAVAPDGWELLQRIDQGEQPLYQAVYRGPTGVEAAARSEWSFTEEAATSLVHLVVIGAGSSLVANAAVTTGESDTTVAPLSIAPEDDSLMLDTLAADQVDGFLAPVGMVTEHADQFESFSTAVVSQPVGAGELPDTAYALASGAAHAGVAVRLVLGPASDPTAEQQPSSPEQPAEPVNDAEAQPAIDPGPSAPVGPAPEAEFLQPESDVSPVLEVNEGQFDDQVDAVVRGEDATVFLAAGNLVYDVRDGAERQAVRMGIVGADPEVVPALSGVEDGVVNYFIGSDPAAWVTDVEVAEVIEYEDVVGGVDIRYLGTEDGLRYDLLIDAGVDPESVELSFDGAEGVRIDAQGDLIVAVEVGDDLVFSAPVTYQEIEGERIPVESGYRLDGDLIGFELGDYDPAHPVVIDPTLQYGSYLGGAGTESGEVIAVDGSGNIVVAGYSASADYPTTVGALDTSLDGSNDVTITKLSADGTTVLWSTYVGGSGDDTVYDMALDPSGNIYTTVFTTSSNFPTSAGAYDTSLSGPNDGIVFKLAAAGNALSYSTYLGAAGNDDYLHSIAVDGSGQAVIAGATDGSGYPTTAGAYDTSFGGSFDAVVTKLNATGTGLVWSTFLGGSGSDSATEVALDASGNVYITGQAASGYPTTPGAYDATVSGTFDGHATKLSSTGASLQYATVFGGTGNDKGTAIAITDATTLYVAGDTPSSDFPTTAGAYDTTRSSSDDMFALKLDLAQTGSAQLSYSTFIGGTGLDRVNALAVDSNGRAHVAGWTQSSGLATAGAYDTTLGGSSDGVLAILGANGTTMTELTYVGGEGNESATSVHLSGSSIYLTGSTGSTAFPVTGSTYDVSLGGSSDAFVVRFAAAAPDPQIGPVVLDAIQKGTATIASGSSSTTATITAVDTSRSFLTFSVRGDRAEAAAMWVTGNLTNSTTVTFLREGTTGTVTIEWSVVEFTSGVSVQRGSAVMSAATTDVSIAATDHSRSFVIVSHRVPGTNIGANDMVAASLTSSTNLRLQMNSFFAADVEWQVVQYNDSAVQSGSVTLGSTSSSAAAAVSALDPANTWLLYSVRTDDGTGSNIGQKLVRGQVTNSTTLTFDRSATGQAMVIEWFAVEFTDGVVVQRGNAGFGSSTATVDSSITAVDAARSISVGGYLQYGGRTAYGTASNPGYGWGTVALTLATNVRVQRDATGATADIAWQVIEWPGSNSAPVATDDSDAISEDGASTVEVLANDSDVDGDTLTVTAVSQGSNGSVVDNGDGTVTYTPDPDWHGTDSFTYTVSDGALTDSATVSVTVTSVNDAPVATDDSDAISEDGSSLVDVLANDSDVDGDVLSVGSITQPANGAVTHNGDGTVTYTPDPDWHGTDSFTYTVTDGTATDTATVWVTVTSVNDAPVAGADSDGIAEDGVSTVDVLTNDSDVDADTLAIVAVTQGSNGSVVDNGDGTVTYTPDPDWHGTDSYTYTVTDGVDSVTATVTVTVTSVNDAPTAVDDNTGTNEDVVLVASPLANDSDVDADILAVVAVTQGSNGSVVDNGDGTVTYTPNPDWNGTDSYTYTVSDGLLTDTATVWVTVVSVNDAPVAADDSDSISEGGVSTVDVLADDSDVDGDVLIVQSVTQGSNGSVVDNGDGTVTYTPNPDWNGTDSYTYTVSDGLLTDTATVWVTVGAVNDAPVAGADSDGIAEDGVSTVDVLANDSDVDADILAVVAVTQGSNGSVTDNGDGTVTYTPAPDWNGVDSFTYTVSDGLLTDTATVWVTVVSVNDAPVAADDSDSISEGGVSTVDVLADDSDVDGDVLIVQSVTQGSNGSVVDNGDGTVTYTPDPSWNGTDSYTYTISDGLLTDTATVTVTVGAVNDAPVATDDSAAISEDGVSTVDVLTNDSDLDGDVLTVQSVTQGSNGSVVDNGDGTITYTPNPDWNGTDAYTYTVTDGLATDSATVTVTVAAVNDFPVAGDDSDSIAEDTAATIDVLGNDIDVDPDPLFVASVVQPAGGIVVDNGDGTLTFTPDPDWNGTATFSYIVSDGALTDTATVTVTVVAVNDAPVAADDTDTISEDGASTLAALANDSDVDGDILAVVAVTQGSNGSVVDNGDGTVTYTPDLDWHGTDTYTYTVSDGTLTDTGTVTVTVTAVNDFPVATDDAASGDEDTVVTVAVLANDVDVDGDAVVLVSVVQPTHGAVVDNGDGTLTYTPAQDWNGTDSFAYTVSDGALTDWASVTVTVNSVNDAPVAGDDADAISEDGASTLDVLANDNDVENDTLTVSTVTQAGNGTVTDNGDGTVTYTPNADWYGVDTFTYTVSDGLLSDTATVTVTVAAVNDQPVAVDDVASVDEDGSVIIDLVANDTDVEGDTLTVTAVTQGSNGSVVDNGDGTVTYTPDPDWHGTDTFTSTVSDGALVETAMVTVTVSAVDDPPVAVDDAASILEDGTSTIDVLANDVEVDDEVLTVTAVTQGSHGSVTDNGDDTITYTPDPDWNGVDTYTYTVSDGITTDSATVTVTVTAVNDAPMAIDDSDAISEDGVSTLDVLTNDSDVDGVPMVSAVTQGSNGVVADNGDGTVTYTPDPDWNGVDTYTYTVSDGVLTATATATVTVAAVNDAPVAVGDGDSILEDGSSTIDVLANDSDVENDTLTVTAVTQGSDGAVVDNGDGTVTYTPDPDWNGVDTYTYTVSDGALTDTATVTVVVASINDVPVAIDDNAGVAEDGSTVIGPLANDTDADGDVLDLVSFGQGSNGTVTDNGDGTVTYAPDPDWNGTDAFTYTVGDGQASDVATVWVVVSPVNGPPVAYDEGVPTDEDTPVVVSVLANDSDVDLDVLSVDSFTQGANGTVTDNGDGTLTYVPDPDFNGIDLFTYVVTDGGLTDSATVTISVGGINDAPVATVDSAAISEDGVSTVDVLANDSDVDGDVLTVQSLTQGSNGSVTDNGDGTVSYTPNPDWNGTDTYTYTVSDGVLTDTATVAITVTAVNDQPVATADADSTAEDTAVTIDVLGNDGDVDGDALFVQTIVQPTNGVVTDNGDGTVTYTPGPDWHGIDSFTYFLGDGALTGSASVAVTVAPVNDDPVAIDDAEAVDEDGVLVFTPLVNDTDVDGDALVITSTTQPTNGTVVDNGDGTVTYTPDPDWNGTDSFTITIADGIGGSATSSSTVTVDPVNDAPVPMPDAEVLAEDTPTIIDVASNDYDVDGDPLVLTATTADGGGVVVILGASTILYTPALDFTGTETITYTVSDGVTTSSGALTVTLLPVNDNVLAVADAVSLDEDRAVTIDVLANDVDVDGDPLSIVSFTATSRATVTRVGRQLRFVPDPDANGVFTFTYTVSDGASASVGVVTATVMAVNDAPIAADDTFSMIEDQAATFDVLANDVDVDGDRLRVDAINSVTSGVVTITADGQARVVPDGDFSGSISFRYTVGDGASTSTAAVSVAVAGLNDAPSVQTTAFSIPSTAPVGTVIGRASAQDPEGDAVAYSGTADRLSVGPDGTLVLTGRADAGETLSVLVRAADTLDAASTAWATVAVTQGNRPPRVGDRSIEIPSDFRDGDVVASMIATDPDGDEVTWSMKGGPGWSIGADDGQVVKGELPGVGQTLAIPITAADPGGLSDTGLLTILVVEPDPDNRPPVARDDAVEIEEDGTVDLSVLGNDSDPDGDAIQILSTSAPAHGTLFDDVDGFLAYKPDRDWFGTERLTYRVSDGRGGVAEAVVVITVTPVNDPPSVLGLRAEVPAGQASLIELPPVSEPDGDAYTLSLTSPHRASATIVDTDEGSRIAFTPAERFEGSTSFEVVAVDEFGMTGSAPVFVEVVVGKTSVSIDVLTGTDVSTGGGGVDETVRNVSPGGLSLFMPLVGEALDAVWASRVPLFALLALLALSLLGSRRLHIRLGTRPLPLNADTGRTWSVVLVQEGQTLPVFSGPDRSTEVSGRLHPLRCDLEGTGELSQTGGVIWVEIDADGVLGWVEANHVVANPRDPLPMSAVTNVLEQMVAAVRGERGLEQWVSGRGLHVSHHAPPFRLTRARVEGAMLDPTQFRWWRSDGVQPDLVGSFNEVVVASVMDAMVTTAAGELSTTPVPGEVLYEFTNFEQVALGTPESGWILCFERGLDNVPLLVGLMKRGALNPASLVLESV